jgi:hypothetical protein
MRAAFRQNVNNIVIVSEDRGLIERQARHDHATRDRRELAMERTAREGEHVVNIGAVVARMSLVSGISLALRTLPARSGRGQRPEGAEHVQERGFHAAALKGFQHVEVTHGFNRM